MFVAHFVRQFHPGFVGWMSFLNLPSPAASKRKQEPEPAPASFPGQKLLSGSRLNRPLGDPAVFYR